MSVSMRKPIVWFTLVCFVATQTVALAAPDPRAEGVAAGQAANPVARGSVTTPSAASVVPGYTTTPAESSYYRQPDLSSQGSAHLAGCATMPNDPVCQAQRGAMTSANTTRSAVGASDPSVAAAEASRAAPLPCCGPGGYYSACTPSTTTVPAGMQRAACAIRCRQLQLLQEPDGRHREDRELHPGRLVRARLGGQPGARRAVHSGPPGDGAAFSGHVGGSAPAFFDVDMSTPVVFPTMAAVLSTAQGIRTGVWVADQSCNGDACSLTAMLAAERNVICIGGGESSDLSCTSVEPFIKRYAACPTGTQSGDHIQDSVCQIDSGCTTSVLDGSMGYAPSAMPTSYAGIDITGTVPGSYWNLDSNRDVTGWSPNPAFGSIPTVRLSYTRPLATTTATDRWDDQCSGLSSGGRCTVDSAAICVDGPSTR